MTFPGPVTGRASETVVIGGGVIGASIAYHLAQRGVETLLLEAGGLASGTSGACDGMVFLQSKKPGLHLNLAQAGIRSLERLARVLPREIEFQRSGGMVVAFSEEELEALARLADRQRREGLAVDLLDAHQARSLEGCLGPEVRGATHCASDGQVNPLALTLGLAQGARLHGARIHQGEKVIALRRTKGRIEAVITDQAAYPARTVINAAGVRAPEIGRMAGLDLPIIPRRGQLLVTEPSAKLKLGCCLISAGYLAVKYNPELSGKDDTGVSIEQAQSGSLLLGSSREFVAFDRRTTLDQIKKIARRACSLVPGLKELNLIRTFAGLRPFTRDGLPLIGPVDSVPGFIVAAGHEGDGIALSAITGELVAQLAAEDRTGFPLDQFAPGRFAEAGVKVHD